MFLKRYVRNMRCFIFCLLLLTFACASLAQAETLETRFPGLSQGMLKSAVLEPMDEDTVLLADGIHIKRSELLERFKDQEPKVRAQLEKNLLFVLEQEATVRVLRREARAAGMAENGDDGEMIQALFKLKAEGQTVSDEEVRAFYASNKQMIGDAPFEQVEDSIRQYLLQDKKQKAVSDYLGGLGGKVRPRLNAKWAEQQSRLAMDNPVDKARRSGKPTMVEFGATGCVPCDMMQPILERLHKDYPQKLNVVFVHIGEEQVLGSRYGIRSIPVQVFFDAKGKEVFRHVGFFAQNDVEQQLAGMGVKK